MNPRGIVSTKAERVKGQVPSHSQVYVDHAKELRVRVAGGRHVLDVSRGTAQQCAMGWATGYIDRLKRGETVQFRPRGNSMAGKINSGQLCTVVPVKVEDLRVGDIVLCKVNGFQYLHLVKAIQGKRFQIGNNRGRINGWIGENGIYGKCVRVE